MTWHDAPCSCTKKYREGDSLWNDKEIMSKASEFRPFPYFLRDMRKVWARPASALCLRSCCCFLCLLSCPRCARPCSACPSLRVRTSYLALMVVPLSRGPLCAARQG